MSNSAKLISSVNFKSGNTIVYFRDAEEKWIEDNLKNTNETFTKEFLSQWKEAIKLIKSDTNENIGANMMSVLECIVELANDNKLDNLSFDESYQLAVSNILKELEMEE